MNADALLEGEYIKAVELDGTKLPVNPTYRITAVDIERMPNIKKPGKEINKGVVTFAEIERGWVMNRTNVECLKALFGAETKGWLGKRVTLGVEPTKTGPGIRVVGSPDIEREVIAEWTPPRQKRVTKRMVPTGNGPQRQAAPPPGANLVADVAKLLDVTAEVVTKFFAAVPIIPEKCNAADVAAILADLQPGGPLRERFEAGPGDAS